MLGRAIFPSLIGKEILLPLLPSWWRGWHLPWASYFYKLRSPTPSIFSFAVFLSISTLDFLRYRRALFVSEISFFLETPVSAPHIASSVFFLFCLYGLYLLGVLLCSQFLVHLYADFPITLICWHACLMFNCRSLLFMFYWSSCNNSLIVSRLITAFFHIKG